MATFLPEASFCASKVLFSFEEGSERENCQLRDRSLSRSPFLSLPRRPTKPFLRGGACVLDSGRAFGVLRQILGKLSSRRRKANWREVAWLAGERQEEGSPHLPGLAEFRRLRRHCSMIERDWIAFSLKKGGATDRQSAQARIRLADGLALLRLRQQEKLSLRQLAVRLRMSEGRVQGLWTTIKRSAGQNLVELAEKLQARSETQRFLSAFFQERKLDPTFLNASLRWGHQEAQRNAPEELRLSFSQYYLHFKRAGFALRSIRYIRKTAHPLAGQHVAAFVALLTHFVVNDDQFEVVFLDESALHPCNFKKFQWRMRGHNIVTPSALKYEKVTMVGAMGLRQVKAVQFLASGFSAAIFNQFVAETLWQISEEVGTGRQIVLVLDNCSSHRSADLLRFCCESDVVVLFGLPHKSQFNAIEYLWEHLKRPFRQMVDYLK